MSGEHRARTQRPSERICRSRWNTDNKDDEALTIKLPSISSIDWEALTRVDSQMEEALKQCQQDIGQYEQFYQNLIKEVIEPSPHLSTHKLFDALRLHFRFASCDTKAQTNRPFVPELLALPLAPSICLERT